MSEHTPQQVYVEFAAQKSQLLHDLETLCRGANAIDDALTRHWAHPDPGVCTGIRDGKRRLRATLGLLAGLERSLKDALDAVSGDLRRAPSRAVAHPDAPATWSPTQYAAAAGGVIG
jgi:hypothetical protein